MVEILTHLSDRDLNIMASALHRHLTRDGNAVQCIIDHPECLHAIKFALGEYERRAMIEEFEK